MLVLKREHLSHGTIRTALMGASFFVLMFAGAATAQTAAAPNAAVKAKPVSAAPASQQSLVCPLPKADGQPQAACPATTLTKAPLAAKKPATAIANAATKPTAPIAKAPAPVTGTTLAATTPPTFKHRPLHARTPATPVILAAKPAPKKPLIAPDGPALSNYGSTDTAYAVMPGHVPAESGHDVLLTEAVSNIMSRATTQLAQGPSAPNLSAVADATNAYALANVSSQMAANTDDAVRAAITAAAPVEAEAAWPTAPVQAAAAAPQAPTATAPSPVQARGLSSGQDVAALGLRNEHSFTVNGLGVGQILSAYEVGLPSMINQIMANDEVRGALTAPQAASPEEATPDFAARVTLARQLMRVDGTDDLIRHLVNTVHMKLVVNEVNKYLNINSLPETERYRLSAIVATSAADLSDRILNLNARTQARIMNEGELNQLIKDLDVDAQKKLTRLRLEDDGALDKQAELEIQLAQLQIIKAFERR